MNGLHCKFCLRSSPMQDKSNIFTDSNGSNVYQEHVVVFRLKSDSFPYDVADGHWLWRTSGPEVINVDLKNSFDPSNTIFFLDTPSISSLGNLVCPASAVSASQHSELSETEFSLNDTLSQIGLDNCTYQAPGRDGQTEYVSQGLAAINHGHMQPCGSTDVFDPLSLQLENIAVDELLVDSQPPLRSDIPNLSLPAQQSSANLSESSGDGSFIIAPSPSQISSFVGLGGAASYDDLRHQSPLYAMNVSQPVVELQSLLEPAHNGGVNLSAGQLLFPNLDITSSDWYDEVHYSIDAPIATSPLGEQSSTGIPAILSSAGHGKGKMKMISVHCCPHHDCDYTAKIWRDVERHLGSKKHGGSSSRFPCSIEGCNALKENTRRDNLKRHMRTVHGVIMPEMRKGRREKRYRVQSQAQQ